ncbi:unnamed protein product [Gadus morhua 'NCC']
MLMSALTRAGRPRQLESPQLSSPRLMLLSGPAPPPGTTDSTAMEGGAESSAQQQQQQQQQRRKALLHGLEDQKRVSTTVTAAPRPTPAAEDDVAR